MKKFKDLNFVMPYIFIVCLSLAFYGGYLEQTYQTDTYNNLYNLQSNYQYVTLNTGRYLQFIYFKICYSLGNNPPATQIIHVSLALIINALLTYVMYITLYRRLQKKGSLPRVSNFMLFLAVLCTRFNVFFSDILQYGDAATVSFMGDLFAVISAIYVSKENGTKKDILVAAILLILSVSTSQTNIFWFVFFSMLLFYLDYLRAEFEYPVLQELFKRIAIYFIASVFVLFCFKFLITKPIDGRGDLNNWNLSNSIGNILSTIKHLLINCMGIMPKFFFCIIGFLFFLLLVLSVFKFRTQIYTAKFICVSLLVLIGTFGSIFIVGLFDSWMAHRSVVGYSSLVSMLALMLLIILHQKSNQTEYNNIIQFTGAIILSVFLLVNWYCTLDIYKGQITTNAVDQREVGFYYSKILEYEAKTNNRVENLAFTYDKSPTWSYPTVKAVKSINVRAMANDWAWIPIFRFVTGRTFNKISYPEDIYEEHVLNKDWSILSEEQIYCEGNTAYICWY
ncbi:glucosyltransferase domain-containing protein [Lacrimispora brassicae]